MTTKLFIATASAIACAATLSPAWATAKAGTAAADTARAVMRWAQASWK
ncbi:MAG: hypothetical protein U0361_07875 [Nitrospiraceae bacterium]